MADFHVLPVLDIQSDNIQEAWPTLKLAVKTSTFVALDTELSGLGNRRQLNAKSADERYEALSNISRTRSILSVGLSSFKLIIEESSTTQGESSTNQEVWSSQTQSSRPGLKFQVQTFNIFMLCSEDFVVEPLSLRFLTEHGFDFNRQYAKGIPYYRGIDKKNKDRQWLRELFAEMIINKVPTVFHNAFVDLGYLYQSFHTDMPANMMSFLADLTELFPGGIYDTKYITETTARFQASYLQYVFRKCQRINNNRAQNGESHVQVATLNYPLECSYVSKLPCAIFRHPAGNIDQVCHLYAAHGWCSAGVACPKSHDVDLILDTEDHISSRKKNKRKRKKPKLEDSSEMEAEPTEAREECILNTDSVIIDDRGNTELASDNANTVKARAMDVVTECGADSSTTESSTAESRTGGHHAGSTEASTAESRTGGHHAGSTEASTAESRTGGHHAGSTEASTAESRTGGHHAGSTEASTAESRTGGHRAGFDAFMTGFIFAHYISQYGTYTELSNGMCLGDLGVEQFTNKVTLTGKDIPLQIVKSTFAKTSKDHNEKMQRIMKNQ